MTKTMILSICLLLIILNTKGCISQSQLLDQMKGKDALYSKISSCTFNGLSYSGYVGWIFDFQGVFRFIYYKMNKPLSHSINPITIDKDKLNIMTVQQVIHEFNMKSPKHRPIHLFERSPSASKSLCSPRNQKIVQIKLPKCDEMSQKMMSQGPEKKSCHKVELRKEERSAKKNLQSINIQKLRELPIKQPNKSIVINIPIEKPKERTLSAKKNEDFRTKTVNRLMKQISQLDQKISKQNVPKIPGLNIKPAACKKILTPLSDRNSNEPPLMSHKRSTTTRSMRSIKLSEKNSTKPVTSRNVEQQNFFRKGSSQSTLSMKTKHILSMQFLDDCEELFSNLPTRMSEKSQKGEKSDSKGHPLSALQEVKSKIFSQIDSLDKQLLTTKIKSESTKHLKISLKKKVAKLQTTPIQQN